MAFDVQTLTDAARCAECLSPNQKQNVLLYLLNGILENGTGGGGLHNLLSLTHPDTVPGPPTRGALVVGNATPDWEALLIGAANRVLRSDGVDATWSQVALTTDVTGILPIANGGTGTSTVFTQGSVIFAGAAGVYSEDNANFFWDDTNNRLGIGTITPAAYLELSSNLFPSNNALVITLSNSTGTNFPNIFYRRSRGTVALPTAVLADDRLGGFGFRGYGATGYFTADNAVFRVFAAENFTNTEQGTYFTFESTPIGSITRLERMRIDTFSISMPPTGAAAGRTNELRFLELAASGVNYTGFRASDAMAASEIYVLPNAAPSANRFLRAGAVAAGVSTLSWAQISLTADVTGILPVANGGTGTSTAFTLGSVIFAGAAGVLSQDNANFFWDDTGNQLRINQLVIPKVTSSTVGGIYFAAGLAVHNFGTSNFFLGMSGNLTMSGANNIGLGDAALTGNTSGAANMAIGVSTLTANTSGASNVGVGFQALLSNTTGSSNMGIGRSALQNNIDGEFNVAVGGNALFANTSGFANTAIGASAMQGNTTSEFNIGIGYSALFTNTTSGYSVAIGPYSLLLATGASNIAIGYHAADNLTTGANNIIIGYNVQVASATQSNTLQVGSVLYGTNIYGTGNIGISVITPLAKFHVVNSAAATVATIIKAAAAQSANLTEWQDSSAVILSKFDSAGNLGVRMAATALSAYLHIAAGTATANTAPLKFTSGTLNTVAVAGQHEYNGNHYLTNVGLLRFPLGGPLFDSFADSSVGGAESDIFSSTLLANTFNGNGDKVFATYGGNFVTIGTESVQLKAKFAGNTIWDSTAIAISTGTTSWRVHVELIRVSSTVIRYTVSLNTTGASGFVYAVSGELTGLTLSGTNALALTGTSSGVGSGAGDIIGKMSCVEFKPAV